MKFSDIKINVMMLSLALPISASWASININNINKDALIKTPEVIECELENGVKTSCAKFIVKYQPDNLVTGPFCPETIQDKGGIWDWDGDEAGLYRIDEAFLSMLSVQGFTFFDEDGNVLITDVRTTRPANNNTCLQASLDTSVEMTVLIPMNPVKAKTATELGTVAKVGLALDGVPIFADAPSVLDRGHMPALDTCGGHVDPGGWYHWHATATDINSVFKHEHVEADCAIEQKASAMFAYAFDGYPIYGSLEDDGKVPTDLDACNGHTGVTQVHPEGSYHYHASTTFPNLPTCLSGVVAKNNFSTNAAQGIGAHGGTRPVGPDDAHKGPRSSGRTPPGFDQAAEKLGIPTEKLFKVVEKNGGRQLDVSTAAKELGITTAELEEALPRPPR